jgi:hypothetical protein
VGIAAKEAAAGLPWSQARPIWVAASTEYAEGASGIVVAFVSPDADPASIFYTVELPALMNNPNVTGILIYAF